MTARSTLSSLIFALCLAAFAASGDVMARDACVESGKPYTVSGGKAVSGGNLSKGDIVFKLSNGSYCHQGQTYKRREVRAKPSNDGIATRKCNTQVASGKAYAGGAGRGNGCN